MFDKCSNMILDATNKELNLKGSVSFPVAIYYDNLSKEPVPYHWHEEVELIVVLTGEMELLVELEHFVVKAGEGIFVNTGRLHSCTPYTSETCTLKSFVFHPRFIYGDLSSLLYEQYLYPLLQEEASSTWRLNQRSCERLLEAYDTFVAKEFGYEFHTRERLTEILLYIIQTSKSQSVTVDIKKMKRLKRCKIMMSYIQKNFNADVTLSDIAESAGVKESECLRCFKKVLNISPIKYLKTYRLQQSALLLRTTATSIIDVGFQCGFTDMSYYAKSFKEEYGMTPTQYRTVI